MPGISLTCGYAIPLPLWAVCMFALVESFSEVAWVSFWCPLECLSALYACVDAFCCALACVTGGADADEVGGVVASA